MIFYARRHGLDGLNTFLNAGAGLILFSSNGNLTPSLTICLIYCLLASFSPFPLRIVVLTITRDSL